MTAPDKIWAAIPCDGVFEKPETMYGWQLTSDISDWDENDEDDPTGCNCVEYTRTDLAQAAVAAAREDGMREAANSVLQAAGQEYVLVHTSENEDARMGRHSAVRGMMVRMGIYAELEDAIEAAITKGTAT